MGSRQSAARLGARSQLISPQFSSRLSCYFHRLIVSDFGKVGSGGYDVIPFLRVSWPADNNTRERYYHSIIVALRLLKINVVSIQHALSVLGLNKGNVANNDTNT